MGCDGAIEAGRKVAVRGRGGWEALGVEMLERQASWQGRLPKVLVQIQYTHEYRVYCYVVV